MRASVAGGLHASTWTSSGGRAAPPAEVARSARYYMTAQIESGHLCPITMTRAALAALAAGPALLAQVAPKVVTTSYDGTFKPWWEKPGMTLGMGMTEKQGGTDVRANSTTATPIWRFLFHHRAQVVSLGADVRRFSGAGAGAGRAHLFLRAAVPSRRRGQCAAAAAPQGQARQPIQRVERSRVRRRLCACASATRARACAPSSRWCSSPGSIARWLQRASCAWRWRRPCTIAVIARFSRSICTISR